MFLLMVLLVGVAACKFQKNIIKLIQCVFVVISVLASIRDPIRDFQLQDQVYDFL